MCFADFSVNSQPIFFARTIFESPADYREIFIKKYSTAGKLDHPALNNFNLTSLMGLYRDVETTNLLHVKWSNF